MSRQFLLFCGIFASLWYILLNAVIPFQWPEYSIADQTVSELSAIGAPTRALWVPLCVLYVVFFALFGWGVRQSAFGNRKLRLAGAVIIIYSIFNTYWPPMHLRGNPPTLTDTLHILWAMLTLGMMLVIMWLGASAIRGWFKWYTVATVIVFLIFGTLTGLQGPNIPLNLPTPMIGVWERINIAAFMVWVIVFAIVVMRRRSRMAPQTQGRSSPGSSQTRRPVVALALGKN